ncbi:hypothetical protein [Neptunomonas phycophila]|uniref:hypothetical protein n=1 Tax=Neptunomonas phycophila TaxID=1572645 RepID=UPI0035136A5C
MPAHTRKNAKKTLLSGVSVLSLLTFISTASYADAIQAASPAERQAINLVSKRFPKALDIETQPLAARSNNALVAKVLKASTEVFFTLDGDNMTAIMLPDGLNLIVGKVIEVDAPANRNARLTPAPITNKSEMLAALKEKTGARTTEMPPKTDIMDGYRFTEDRLTPMKNSPYNTPELFAEALQAHHTLTTGTGSKHLYIFTDPNCPNCRKEYALAKDHESDFTFHWIPIYALSPEPRAEQIALTQPSDEVSLQNMERIMESPSSVADMELLTEMETVKKIRDNQILFYHIKDKRTPITMYLNTSGKITAINGHNPKLFNIIFNDM